MREVLTYSRRGSRFTPTQASAWEAHHERWVIPDHAVDDPGFAWRTWFGRDAPLVVEIGSGIGESTAALAAARPAYDVLALEVWLPGVADGLGRVAEAGATNVRFCAVDAVWTMEHLVAEGSLAGLWTFFPDPWPKKRHHKRRLVKREFAHLAATRLAPGAIWLDPARLRAAPARPGGWPRTGPTTPSRCARCSTRSRCWTAALPRGGTTDP